MVEQIFKKEQNVVSTLYWSSVVLYLVCLQLLSFNSKKVVCGEVMYVSSLIVCNMFYIYI